MQCVHVQLEKTQREMDIVRSENAHLKQFIRQVSIYHLHSDNEGGIFSVGQA